MSTEREQAKYLRYRRSKGVKPRSEYDSQFASRREAIASAGSAYLVDYSRYRARLLFTYAKRRATKKGIQFTITLADVVVPELCPVLGIKLKSAPGPFCWESATLDRVDPARGYVPGNVAVISARANSLKNDATLHELLSLVTYVQEYVFNSSRDRNAQRRSTHVPGFLGFPAPR